MKTTGLKALSFLGCAVFVLSAAFDAEAQREKTKPDASPGASVSQIIGIDSHIAISYHRPGVKGREGKVYGKDVEETKYLAPYGGDPMPWRGGANETTTFEFENDVKIEGKALPAGKYGFHIIPSESEWILVFNKTSSAWGSFGYKKEDDALRVTVKPQDAAHQEWLIYTFEELSAESVVVQLRWESKKIRFKVELDDDSA